MGCSSAVIFSSRFEQEGAQSFFVSEGNSNSCSLPSKRFSESHCLWTTSLKTCGILGSISCVFQVLIISWASQSYRDSQRGFPASPSMNIQGSCLSPVQSHPWCPDSPGGGDCPPSTALQGPGEVVFLVPTLPCLFWEQSLCSQLLPGSDVCCLSVLLRSPFSTLLPPLQTEKQVFTPP